MDLYYVTNAKKVYQFVGTIGDINFFLSLNNLRFALL